MSEIMKFYNTGDEKCTTLQFIFEENDRVNDADVSIGLPSQATLDSAVPSHGVVNGTTWTIPSLIPGNLYFITLCYTLDFTGCGEDIFPLKFTLDADCDCIPESCIEIPGVSCCDFESCYSELNVCSELKVATGTDDGVSDTEIVVALDNGNGVITPLNYYFQDGVFIPSATDITVNEGTITVPFDASCNPATCEIIVLYQECGEIGSLIDGIPTPTPSPTPSATPSPTPSPSPTASASPTPSPTASASPTPSPTASASPTPSPTASATPAPTASPTASPSPTPSPSPSATP